MSLVRFPQGLVSHPPARMRKPIAVARRGDSDLLIDQWLSRSRKSHDVAIFCPHSSGFILWSILAMKDERADR
jgi:hypothetical protein